MNQTEHNNRDKAACRKMVDSGVDWIGEIPEGWGVARLAETTRIFGGGTPPESEILHDESGIFWATPADMVSGNAISSTKRKITQEGARKSGKILPINSILVSGRAPVGKVCLVKEPMSFNQGCKGLVFYSEYSPNFFSYVLQAAEDEMQLRATGTTFLEINTTALGQIEVPHPSHQTQVEIASFLDHHTSLIDRERELISAKIEALREQRKALIFECVTGKRRIVEVQHLSDVDDWSDIVRVGDLAAVPVARKDFPFVKEGRLVDSGVEWIGEIPEGWEVLPVKSLTKNTDGMRVPLSADKRIAGDTPYYGPGGISDYVVGYTHNFSNLLLVGEDGAPFGDKHKDVAFLIHGKAWINNHVHAILPHGQHSPSYLRHALNCVDYMQIVSGATLMKLTQKSLNEIKLPIPNKDEQQAIASFLDHYTSLIDKKIALLVEKNNLLSEKRKALIFEAVTGKLDITG